MSSNEKDYNILLGLPLGKNQQKKQTSVYDKNYRTLENVNPHGAKSRSRFRPERSNEIIYDEDSHLMTIAPTGAGKGRSVIIPNLLHYRGPVIVVDPKGENYSVTSKYRRDVMGHKIIKLDPFNVTEGESDSFNPFDILPFTKNVSDEARMLAELIMVGQKGHKEPFWDNWGSLLISGLVIFLAFLEDNHPKYDRSFIGVRDMLYGDDAKYQLAVLLDTLGKKMPPEAYQSIATVLSINADVTFSGVLSTAQQYLTTYGTDSMKNVLRTTSFDVKGILRGDPISMYIIIPPSKLVTHRSLFRLWVGALLSLFSSRTVRPEQSTLFMIDEAAQLGELELLHTAKTLLRGYGLQTWSFWQDLSQIQALYDNWETMVHNCAVLQVFGAKNYMVAERFADIVGGDANEIRRLDDSEQILVVNGNEPILSSKFDYLRNEQFSGQWSPNPIYDNPNTAQYDDNYLDEQRALLKERIEKEQAARPKPKPKPRKPGLPPLKPPPKPPSSSTDTSDDSTPKNKANPFDLPSLPKKDAKPKRTNPFDLPPIPKKDTKASKDEDTKPKRRNPFDLPPIPKKPSDDDA